MHFKAGAGAKAKEELGSDEHSLTDQGFFSNPGHSGDDREPHAFLVL